MAKKYTYIDLFAGCGGLSLGLHRAGWKGLFAIEKSPMAFGTLKHNLIDKLGHFSWPKWLPIKNHNIKTILSKYKSKLKKMEGKVTLVCGGPPCQGFSSAGRRNEGDSRNKLVHSYIEFIGLVKPKILFFENVIGFTYGFRNEGKEKVFSEFVEKKLGKMGYDVKAQVVNFSEFGIPQRRKRFILVGIKGAKGKAGLFFERIVEQKKKFLKAKGLDEHVTLREAISDLKKGNGVVQSTEFKKFKEGIYSKPTSSYQVLLRQEVSVDRPNSHRFANHNKDTIKRFNYILDKCTKDKKVPENIRDKFGLKKHSIRPLSARCSSPTLTTLPDDYIHYNEPRILTVREFARIQSFDDSFEFTGKYTTGGKLRKKEVPRYTQVGNAVPPLFAELSGQVLKELSCRN